MGSINLPAEFWLIVAAVAGFMVLLCLSILSSTLEYEVGVRKLAEEVRRQRSRFGILPGSFSLLSPSRETKDPPFSAVG